MGYAKPSRYVNKEKVNCMLVEIHKGDSGSYAGDRILIGKMLRAGSRPVNSSGQVKYRSGVFKFR